MLKFTYLSGPRVGRKLRPHLVTNNWGNVYRLGEQPWCIQTPDGTPPPSSLSRWQALWHSDADSIRLDPREHDPLQWKLLPGTPGSKQGPEGKDMGADTSRIGTVAAIEPSNIPLPKK